MPKTELEIMVSNVGDVDVASLDGPVDSATFAAMKNSLDPLCNKPGNKVLIDCEGLTYLNSRAIGLLVKYHRALSLGRGRLAFCCINKKVVRSLELLQLGKALRVYKTRDEAVESMK